MLNNHNELDAMIPNDVIQSTSKYEYDKWPLVIAFMNYPHTLKLLPKKWNNWELSTEKEVRASDSIFFQSHEFLDIIKK